MTEGGDGWHLAVGTLEWNQSQRVTGGGPLLSGLATGHSVGGSVTDLFTPALYQKVLTKLKSLGPRCTCSRRPTVHAVAISLLMNVVS